jgi:hypothetical protein
MVYQLTYCADSIARLASRFFSELAFYIISLAILIEYYFECFRLASHNELNQYMFRIGIGFIIVYFILFMTSFSIRFSYFFPLNNICKLRGSEYK